MGLEAYKEETMDDDTITQVQVMVLGNRLLESCAPSG